MEAEVTKLINAILKELEQEKTHLSLQEWETLYQQLVMLGELTHSPENNKQFIQQLLETLQTISPIAQRFGRFLGTLQARLVRVPTGVKRRPTTSTKLRPLFNKLVTLSEKKRKDKKSTNG